MSEMPPIEPAPAGPSATAPGHDGLPWEESSAGIGSLFPTAAQFIGSPFRAFGRMSLNVDLVRPIAYFVAFVLFGTLIGQMWNFVLLDTVIGMVSNLVPPQLQALLHKPSTLQIVFGLVISPLVSLIVLFIWSGVVHLILAMLGGAGSGFAATLRTVCYARTSDVATLVPFLGGLIGFVWGRALEIIGLSRVHKTDGWKAAVAVLVPLFLCCVCLVGGAMAFGAAIAQALQQLK